MTRKNKQLHNITIEGCTIQTQLRYNLNTNHIGIGTVSTYRDPIKQKSYNNIHKDKIKTYYKIYNKVHYKINKNKRNMQTKIYYNTHRDPNTPHKESEEYRIRISCRHQKINRDEWKGFITDRKQSHLIQINQCTQLNKRFKGSEGHHIMSGVVIFVPKYLHQNIQHNLKSGKNISKINQVAWDYLLGKL